MKPEIYEEEVKRLNEKKPKSNKPEFPLILDQLNLTNNSLKSMRSKNSKLGKKKKKKKGEKSG